MDRDALLKKQIDELKDNIIVLSAWELKSERRIAEQEDLTARHTQRLLDHEKWLARHEASMERHDGAMNRHDEAMQLYEASMKRLAGLMELFAEKMLEIEQKLNGLIGVVDGIVRDKRE